MTEDHAGQSIPYPPHFFKRQDEWDDELFYDQPRLVVHIDDHAIAAIGAYFQRTLPQNGVLLDIMSSWRSHLPQSFPKVKLVGLGLNAVEMAENPQLDEWVVHNVNTNPLLPFDDASFDAAMVTVSIQYMTKPVELFSEVGRVLKPGAAFHVIYSNRMFPTKAILAWQAVDDDQRAHLIGSYFQNSGGWQTPELEDISPSLGLPTDPVYVVSAKRT
jgi:hypothetical protein